MNLKRLIVTGSAIALMMGSAVPAFADHDEDGGNGGTTNVAFVTNSSYAGANTGNNYQGNSVSVKKAGADDVTVNGNNTLTTGKAKANASAVVVANNQVGCGCDDSKVKNVAFVRNGAEAGANSGDNAQGNSASVKKAHADDVTVGGNNTATTGKAKSNSRSWVLVNNQVSF